MSRKAGFGNVVLNGRVLTTQDYKNAAIKALEANGNNWMTTRQIVSWASDNGLVENINRPRKASAHPMWKIMSIMSNDVTSPIKFRYNKKNRLEYQIKPEMVKTLYINGTRYERNENGDLIEKR